MLVSFLPLNIVVLFSLIQFDLENYIVIVHVMWPKKLVGILNGGIESPNIPRWNSFSMCLVSVWKA
jgi:hypothetical protein